MKFLSQFLLLISIIAFTQCASDPVSDWQELSLLEYGTAVSFKAPSSVVVHESNMMGIKDITIKDTVGDYNLQVFISDAQLEEIDETLASLKQDIKETPIFEEVLDSFPQGFIYSTRLDSTTISYDFRYIENMGNDQVQFQMGMGGINSLELVKRTLRGIKAQE